MWAVELAGKIIDWLKKYLDMVIILAIIFVAMFYTFMESDYYKDHMQTPRFHLIHREGMDIFESDIELVSMSITVVPMIKIEYEGKIAYSVEMENFYDKNYAALEDKGQEEICCEVMADKEQRKKGEELRKTIKELLENQWEGSGSFDVSTAYLTYIIWQNEKANTEGEGYWYFSNESERFITKEEAVLQGPDGKIDLDNLNENGFIYNKQIKTVIEASIKNIENNTDG
ncbi:MAG: hypothetical protein HFI96_01035 [Lachnospiraceae bacterium]|jgi:hypothetical protein|nr:hypothetical protein [Lachnospiraceae bacterium]